MRNLATFLPLKSKLSGKFQRFNAIDEVIEVLKNWIFQKFQKISIKMKNCKTFYEAQISSHVTRIIQFFPQPTFTR